LFERGIVVLAVLLAVIGAGSASGAAAECDQGPRPEPLTAQVSTAPLEEPVLLG
jgi:hypothetical protein